MGGVCQVVFEKKRFFFEFFSKILLYKNLFAGFRHVKFFYDEFYERRIAKKFCESVSNSHRYFKTLTFKFLSTLQQKIRFTNFKNVIQ